MLGKAELMDASLRDLVVGVSRMMTRVKKAYESHELGYRKMRKQGLRSWAEFIGSQVDPNQQIDPVLEQFLSDALAQSWAPRGWGVTDGSVIAFSREPLFAGFVAAAGERRHKQIATQRVRARLIRSLDMGWSRP